MQLMANFLWEYIREPVIAAIVMSSIIIFMVVIATLFNFNFNEDEKP